MLGLLLIFIVVAIIATIVAFWADDHNELGITVLSGTMSVVAWIGVIVTPIVWMTTPVSIKADIAEFQAVKASVENSRSADLSEYERVMVQNKVIEWNVWLARYQYANEHYLIECIPEEIMALEPIK